MICSRSTDRILLVEYTFPHTSTCHHIYSHTLKPFRKTGQPNRNQNLPDFGRGPQTYRCQLFGDFRPDQTGLLFYCFGRLHSTRMCSPSSVLRLHQRALALYGFILHHACACVCVSRNCRACVCSMIARRRPGFHGAC